MLTGYPSTQQQASGEAWHHMLGRHDYDLFSKMAERLSAARAILTPENCVAEFGRILAAVLYHKRPGVLAFTNDLVHQPIASAAIPDDVPLRNPTSDPGALGQADDHIVEMMSGVSPVAKVAIWRLSSQRKKVLCRSAT